jgi:hypothetical protein
MGADLGKIGAPEEPASGPGEIAGRDDRHAGTAVRRAWRSQRGGMRGRCAGTVGRTIRRSKEAAAGRGVQPL